MTHLIRKTHIQVVRFPFRLVGVIVLSESLIEFLSIVLYFYRFSMEILWFQLTLSPTIQNPW